MDSKDDLFDQLSFDLEDLGRGRDPFIEKNMKDLFPDPNNKPEVSPPDQLLVSDDSVQDNEGWSFSEFLLMSPLSAPPVANEIVVSTIVVPTKRKRGRPPIPDPVERNRIRREREKRAAKKYRLKKKLQQTLGTSFVSEWEQTVDSKKRKVKAIVEGSVPLIQWFRQNPLVFDNQKKKQIKQSLKQIDKIKE